MTLVRPRPRLNLELAKDFYQRTHDLKISSDLFRILSLDKDMGDKPHQIGGFFTALLRAKYVQHIQFIRSSYGNNHGRRIGQYLWTERAEKELGKKE